MNSGFSGKIKTFGKSDAKSDAEEELAFPLPTSEYLSAVVGRGDITVIEVCKVRTPGAVSDAHCTFMSRLALRGGGGAGRVLALRGLHNARVRVSVRVRVRVRAARGAT